MGISHERNWEGEAPAEPGAKPNEAQQELRPPERELGPPGELGRVRPRRDSRTSGSACGVRARWESRRSGLLALGASGSMWWS